MTSKPNYSAFTGMVIPYAGARIPEGWLLCTGQPVDRRTYSELFLTIGTTYGKGDGINTFNLPDTKGRSSVGTGVGISIEGFTQDDINLHNNLFNTEVNADKWITGARIYLDITKGSIVGLTTGGSYFIRRIDSNLIGLCATQFDAQSGRNLDIKAVSGIMTCTLTQYFDKKTLGTKGGEQTHAMSIEELLEHDHAMHLSIGEETGYEHPGYVAKPGVDLTDTTGGKAASNQMPPYITFNMIIGT